MIWYPQLRPAAFLGIRRLAVIAALIAIIVLAGFWLSGYRSHVMTTASMGRTAPVGTLVISEPISASTVHVGEIIVFNPPGQPGVTFTHRVVKIIKTARGPEFETRGDINGSTDPWTLTASNLIGRAALRIPVAGYALEMLPGALALFFIIILLTFGLNAERRRAARILLGSLAVSGLIYWYHPLAGLSTIAQTISNGHGQASIVPTGILPLRVSAVHGSHVDLDPGQLGVIHVAHVPLHQLFEMTARVHLSGWWWLVLIAWALPMLIALRGSSERSADTVAAAG